MRNVKWFYGLYMNNKVDVGVYVMYMYVSDNSLYDIIIIPMSLNESIIIVMYCIVLL